MNIQEFFADAIKKGASDVHLIAGQKPVYRIFGKLQVVDGQTEVLNNQELTKSIYETLTKDQIEKFEKDWELDYAHQLDDTRFRVNLHSQLGEIGLAARLIPKNIPTAQDINMEPVLYEMTHLNQGFILVTGPTGCGKSTTLATMLNIVNQERRSHIITLEDPIEFIYPAKQGVVEQREIGRDTRSFQAGLKHILRQDPNVILVGEMRDPETISAALTAAETGHLVFSTLHTNSAAETIERIIDSFDSYRQRQILVQFAASLRAVITQQLVPSVDDKVIAAREIMINTPAVSNLIRQNKISQIPSVIQTGRGDGMISMNNSLKALFKAGKISEEVLNNRLTSSEKGGSYF